MNNLKNKKIIITGASGGIGSSIVEKFYENGANILATGTRVEKLDELKNFVTLNFDMIYYKQIVQKNFYKWDNYFFQLISFLINLENIF